MSTNATKNSPYRHFLGQNLVMFIGDIFLGKISVELHPILKQSRSRKGNLVFWLLFFFLFFDPRTVFKWKILGYTEILAVSIPRQDCGAQHILLKARSEPSYSPFCCCKTRCEELLLCLCCHGDCNADLYLIFKKNKFWYRQQLLGGETFFSSKKLVPYQMRYCILY